MRKIVSSLVLFGFIVGVGSAAQFVRAPYIQLTTDHSVEILWRCNGVIEPEVRFGVSPADLSGRSNRSTIRVRTTESESPLHSAPKNAVQYEVPLTGLAQDTVYYYAIYDGDKLLAGGDESYRFRTHPPIGAERPTRIWVVGDSGTGGEGQKAVFRAQEKFITDSDRPIDVYLHLGDMAYQSGNDGEFQPKFFDIYERFLRHTACWPTQGNHEGRASKGFKGTGPYYDAYVCPTEGEAGGVPSGKEAYYSFDYGQIHFVCLNSFDIPRGKGDPMMAWLKADLAAAAERSKWLVAFWHHPPYTKGSHDSDTEHELVDMRETFMPVLEEAGVDLVLTGHSHIYERSMLIDGAYHTPTHSHGVVLDDGDGNPDGDGAYRKSHGLEAHNGTVAIVAGHGGKLGPWKGVSPIMRTIIVDLGSVILDVDGDTLTGVMLDQKGRARDPFQITKRGTVTPKAVENPWRPTAKDVEDLRPGVSATTPRPAPMAQRMPGAIQEVVPAGAEWHFRTGTFGLASNWSTLGFDVSEWRRGPVGLGYDYPNEVRTALPDMLGNYTQVQLRTTFSLEKGMDKRRLGLGISYDDAFVCFINGKRAFASHVYFKKGKPDVRHHESVKEEYFSLAAYGAHFKEGVNVIGIHGYNVNAQSSDFLLDPRVVLTKPRPSRAKGKPKN